MEIKKGKRGRKHQYELSFKRKVAEELLSGQISVGEISRKYQLSSGGTVMRWVTWYQKEQQELLSSNIMKNPEVLEIVEGSAEYLQNELSLAKAKITTLEVMIDIAEQQFKIEIRKKSGTKPSLE